jgi:hypothetical protein
MGRWLRVLLGPLPATILLLPLLFAGGLGAAAALITALVQPGRSVAQRWDTASGPMIVAGWIAAAAVGVLSLWLVVLADTPTTLRQSPLRWWLASGLTVGLLAAARWLWTMAMAGHSYDLLTWGVWLAMLTGPVVLGCYYVVRLVRGGSTAA